ncbi:MAG: dephospho-CoA kinase [Gallionellaceae bacterium]|nr:dephospho-CoA kinase [Gallionellaceae bacterium]
MTRPYCVGLTGGIGSGKSRVASLFAEFGAGVVDTDLIARELTAPGGAAMAAIRAGFGAGVVACDGGLDRAAMRRLVFADAGARRRLEAILHPLIRARAAAAVAAATAPYVLLVVPLLIETGAYGGLLDRVLVVDCSPARQIERVMRRDGVTAATAQAMLAAQAGRAERLAAADDVIDNEGEPEHLAAAVAALHRAYLQAARDHAG